MDKISFIILYGSFCSIIYVFITYKVLMKLVSDRFKSIPKKIFIFLLSLFIMLFTMTTIGTAVFILFKFP